MLLGNYTIANRNAGREYNPGSTLNYYRYGTYKSIGLGDAEVTNETNRAALPNGYGLHYAYVLPQKAGGIVSKLETVSLAPFADGQMGVNIDSQVTVSVTGSAVLQLVASLEANGTVTVTASGDGVGVASSPATANVSVIGTLDIQGIGGLLAQATVVASPTADIQATGSMHSLVYLNQSQATVEQIADAVVQAIVDMGATGGLTTEEHTQLMKTLTVGKFLGLK